MTRPISEIINHIRACIAEPSVHTMLVQTEELETLCNAAQASPPADAAGMRASINRIIEEWTSTSTMKLRAGEMTAQEVRTVQAVLFSILDSIRALPIPASPTDAAVKALVEEKR